MKPTDINEKHSKVMKFAEWTMDKIGIKNRPSIELTDDITIVKKNRAYGATTSDGKIWVYVGNRTPADAMRTLCHEILHAKQFEDGVANDHMDTKQEQHIEDLANAHAGRMMRKYGKKDGTIYEGVEPSLMEIGFSETKHDDKRDITLKATTIDGKSLYYRGPVLKVQAIKDGKKIGEALFQEKNNNLFAQDVRVIPSFSGKGLAGMIYRFVRELGATIQPSKKQSDAGADMWNKFYKTGTAQLVMREGKEGSLTHDVSDSLPQAFVIPELSSGNPYLQYKFGVAIAGARGSEQRKADNINPFYTDDNLDDVYRDDEIVVSFDPNIGDIIDSAMKDLGIKGGKRRIGVEGSKEAPDVTSRSPVQGFKGYPR